MKARIFKAQATKIGYTCKGDIMDTNSSYIRVYKDDLYIGKVRFSDHSCTDPSDISYCVFSKGASGVFRWLKETYKEKTKNEKEVN